jgi:hypothetical protein
MSHSPELYMQTQICPCSVGMRSGMTVKKVWSTVQDDDAKINLI